MAYTGGSGGSGVVDPGALALSFTAANLSHVNHGVFWQPATAYGEFFFEALIRPTAAQTGYIISAGKGGAHIFLFGVSGDSSGYILQGNIYDQATVTTTSFQTTEKIRHNEWAHVAVAYDKTNICTIINGVPSAIEAATHNRQTDDIYECVLYIGGSDHLNFEGYIGAARLFEGANMPYASPHATVARPAIDEMAAAVVYRTISTVKTEIPAHFVVNYRDGSLMDYGKGLNSRPSNGYLYAATSENPVLGQYTSASPGNYDASKRPQWVNAPFTYTGTATAESAPGSSVLFDSFGRADVHYGNTAYPLTLGALEKGAVSWSGSHAGILNGNAFCTEEMAAPVVVETGSADMEVRFTRPTASMPGGIGAVYRVYLRYEDANNYIILEKSEFDTISIIERVGGSNNDLGAASFGTGWTEIKGIVSGTTLTTYADGVLKATDTVSSSSSTKAGFWMNSPLLRCSKFEVY